MIVSNLIRFINFKLFLMDLWFVFLSIIASRIVYEHTIHISMALSILSKYFKWKFQFLTKFLNEIVRGKKKKNFIIDWKRSNREIQLNLILFIKNHHHLCFQLRKCSSIWSKINLISILLNLPINIVLINLIFEQLNDSLEYKIQLLIIITHGSMLINVLNIMPPITSAAHSSTNTLFSLIARFNQRILIISQLKTISFLEGLCSKRYRIGITIGSSSTIDRKSLVEVSD